MDAQRVYVDYLYVNKSILAEFTDVRFGKIISRRAELQKALGLCQQQGATLLVAKIDRLIRNIEQALPLYRELDGRLESCDIPSLDKFTLALFMVIADQECELIGLRTKQALDQKRKQVDEWRKGGVNEKKAAEGLLGAQMVREQTNENENKRRTKATMLRSTGESLQAIVDQLTLRVSKPYGVKRLMLLGFDDCV